MYNLIQARRPVAETYADKLIQEHTITSEAVQNIQQGIESCMKEGFQKARATSHPHPVPEFYPSWEHFAQHPPESKTQVAKTTLIDLARKLHDCPPEFQIHPKLKKVLDKRLATVEAGQGIDWATAEALAFATLLQEGYHVRLSGQDSGRGTFSQRHAILYDKDNGKRWIPLQSIGRAPDFCAIHDSSLSEAAVLGFEYGYSLADPYYLVLWEAQFGDFANGAQVIIDQFLASAEAKWNRSSNIVMLLPHGWEGQGPEHSSARLERYLSLCAEENLQVCNLTTPAQYFHALRRQIHAPTRKPLILMTPKSLLRHPKVVSSWSDFEEKSFAPILTDPIEKPRKILLCTGKIYYDLLEAQQKSTTQDCAIIRIEQLYPFPWKELSPIFTTADNCPVYWVQEEPKNMGAWTFIQSTLAEQGHCTWQYIGRKTSASPAVGISRLHDQEQKQIIQQALA